MQQRYLSELRPELKLVIDEPPPKGTKIWMVTRYGHGFSGEWHPEFQVVAWCGLPKFTPEQKRRLMAMEAGGVDPTIHPGALYLAQEANPPSCTGFDRS